MDISLIEPLLNGSNLTEFLDSEKAVRKPIVNSLIYEKTCTMAYGDAGIGKSAIIAQMILELSSGIPIFNYFPVAKKCKVVYCQSERDILEVSERINELKKILPYDEDNIFITDEYQKLDLSKIEHANVLIECLKRDCPDVDVLFFDPIYCMVSDGLASERGAICFNTALKHIQRVFNCATWLSHHSTKPGYTTDGKEIDKKDPYFGSSLIRNNMTAMFHMKSIDKGNGVKLIKTKDNNSNIISEFELEYNHETHICNVKGNSMLSYDKVKHFVVNMGLQNKTFTLSDVVASTGVGSRMARDHLLHTPINDMLEITTVKGSSSLYKMKGC